MFIAKNDGDKINDFSFNVSENELGLEHKPFQVQAYLVEEFNIPVFRWQIVGTDFKREWDYRELLRICNGDYKKAIKETIRVNLKDLYDRAINKSNFK